MVHFEILLPVHILLKKLKKCVDPPSIDHGVNERTHANTYVLSKPWVRVNAGMRICAQSDYMIQ